MWADNPYDRDSPQCPNSNGLAASFLEPGFLRVYGFTVYNSKASSQFLLVFDRSSLPADTAVPLFAIPMAAQTQVSAYYGAIGRIFRQGLILCNSSTDTAKTIGSADCFFDVQYDNLPPPYTDAG